MSTIPETVQRRTDTLTVQGSHKDTHWQFTPRKPLPTRHPGRDPFDPPRVHYTPSWFGLGAAAATLGLAGVRAFGRSAAFGMGALGLLGLAYMRRVEPTSPILEKVVLRLPTVPPALDGLRIGQISDMHLGLPYTEQNMFWALKQMRREQPDLIIITGDLVGDRHAIPDLPRLLRELRAPLGVYAVPGNHDYWEGLADVDAALSLVNIPLLLNESRRLRWNGADFWLLGTDDVWDGDYNIDAALDGVPDNSFKLLLSHAPDTAGEAARRGIDVQLSGHTHGGHLRLPFFGPFTRPRFGAKYVIGRYQVERMALYVSRGLGGTPLRLLCRPESTIFTLRAG
jgi:hypothetical protein